MNTASKKIISIGLIAFLSLHFTFIVTHAFDAKINTTKFYFLTKPYVSTFFHQNWNVFVPAPNSQHYLLVRVKKSRVLANWTDILGRFVENNRHSKFCGNESLILLFSNSLIYELNSASGQSVVFDKSPSNAEFKVLQHEINQYLKYSEGIKEGAEYELIILSCKYNEKRTLYFKLLTVND